MVAEVKTSFVRITAVKLEDFTAPTGIIIPFRCNEEILDGARQPQENRNPTNFRSLDRYPVLAVADGSIFSIVAVPRRNIGLSRLGELLSIYDYDYL